MEAPEQRKLTLKHQRHINDFVLEKTSAVKILPKNLCRFIFWIFRRNVWIRFASTSASDYKISRVYQVLSFL